MEGKAVVAVVGIVCLTVICVVALVHGIDSTVIGTVCSAIGTTIGYYLGKKR